MNVRGARLAGVRVIEPRAFHDARGWFVESWSAGRYAAAGIPGPFVQDNLSMSRRGVLRGLHFQNPAAQGKLVSVPHGAVWDVVVDLRRDSRTFGEWEGLELSAENARQLWIPEGFAHGFVVLSDSALFSYKCTAPWTPAAERTLRWDDPDVAIRWPVDAPVLAPRDADAPLLRELPPEALFGTGAPAEP